MSTSTHPTMTTHTQDTSSTSGGGNDDSGSRKRRSSKQHTRSRNGCYTCRLRRKKCDESFPACRACMNLAVKCEYARPNWWDTANQRRIQKDRITNRIRQVKAIERHGSLREFMNRARESISLRQPVSIEFDTQVPANTRTYGLLSPSLPTPPLVQDPYPCMVNATDEYKPLANNVPVMNCSDIAVAQQQYYCVSPASLPDALLSEYFNQPRSTSVLNPVLFNPNYKPLSSFLKPLIPVVEKKDQSLLSHFVDNILRLAFPVLEVHPQGPETVRAILRSLQTSKPYLHSCLCISAVHRKTSLNLTGEVIDDDIKRHRTEAISHLTQAIRDNVNYEQIMEAALALIFFHCAVGSPEDDELSYIPWDWHFQAVVNNMDRLGMMTANTGPEPAFSMTLTSWIDILGATMLGKMPSYANQYRTKYLSGTSSGLKELMGCDDRIMYLISEMACLDSLKVRGQIDDLDVCHHVALLVEQLGNTEPLDQTLQSPYSAVGVIRSEQLTRNISALFRVAARIYLNSLMPGFDQTQLSTISLVSAAAEILQFIPAGPDGFDLSLVWPLLITGAFSVQSSSFRGILYERVKALGEIAEYGNFSRMYGLLQKVWRLTDDPIDPRAIETDSRLPSPRSRRGVPYSSCIGTPIKKQQVHWRDVMRRNDWHYLLM